MREWNLGLPVASWPCMEIGWLVTVCIPSNIDSCLQSVAQEQNKAAMRNPSCGNGWAGMECRCTNHKKVEGGGNWGHAEFHAHDQPQCCVPDAER